MAATNVDPLKERHDYVLAFNHTMVKIWREKITMLKVIDSGSLYRSVMGISMSMDKTVTDIDLKQEFLKYGLYQDFGTGSNTPIGNPGDIGRNNYRKRRRWFSTKYYASVKNLTEFLAKNVGKSFLKATSNALSAGIARALT